MNFFHDGYCILPTKFLTKSIHALRDTLFKKKYSAGERCLLDHPIVRETALALKCELTTTGHLPVNAVAIQAIAFNKTAYLGSGITFQHNLGSQTFAGPVWWP